MKKARTPEGIMTLFIVPKFWQAKIQVLSI